MFSHLEAKLLEIATEIPLASFAFIGSFVEEVIAPIPSPTVTITVGITASIQDYAIPGLIFLVLIGALGKTLGALFLYYCGEKGEAFMVSRYGQFIGITSADIDRIGSYFESSLRNYALLTFLRALPMFPSVVLSVGGGVLSQNMKMYLVTTFIGTVIKNMLYIYIGYSGVVHLKDLARYADELSSAFTYGTAIVVICSLVYVFYKRRISSTN